MSFNPSKCNIMHVSRKKHPWNHTYTLKNTPLEPVKDATYLGVTLSNNLSWNKHTAKVAAKGNKALGFIKRNIRSASINTKVMAYKAIVRPIAEYASSVWCPHQKEHIQELEMVQRRAARYVMSQYNRTDSVTNMLHTLQWETLEQRRAKSKLIMGYRIVNSLVCIPDNQLIPISDKTRGHSHRFRQIATRTNYHKHSFFPSFIPLWNSLPNSTVESRTVSAFRSRIKSSPLNLY